MSVAKDYGIYRRGLWEIFCCPIFPLYDSVSLTQQIYIYYRQINRTDRVRSFRILRDVGGGFLVDPGWTRACVIDNECRLVYNVDASVVMKY